jgi:hypothetical protein
MRDSLGSPESRNRHALAHGRPALDDDVHRFVGDSLNAARNHGGHVAADVDDGQFAGQFAERAQRIDVHRDRAGDASRSPPGVAGGLRSVVREESDGVVDEVRDAVRSRTGFHAEQDIIVILDRDVCQCGLDKRGEPLNSGDAIVGSDPE